MKHGQRVSEFNEHCHLHQTSMSTKCFQVIFAQKLWFHRNEFKQNFRKCQTTHTNGHKQHWEQCKCIVHRKQVSACQAIMEKIQATADGKTLKKDNADTVNNNTFVLDGLKNIARVSNFWMSAGGIHEEGASPAVAPVSENNGNGAPRPQSDNTYVVLDNQCKIQAVYHKIHLFDVVILGKVNLQENASAALGDEMIASSLPVVKFCARVPNLNGKHKVIPDKLNLE